MSRPIQTLIALLVLACVAAYADPGAPTPSEAVGTPDATLSISGHVIALGVGYEWARGTLTYQGQSIPFWVHGLSVMDIGAAKITGVGEVFNLKSVAGFAGDYVGSTFGSAVAHGQSMGLVKNANGVVIRVRSAESGMRLNFSGNTVRIRLAKPAPKAH